MSHYSHVMVFNRNDDGSFKVRVKEDVPGFDWDSLPMLPMYLRQLGLALFVPTKLEDEAEAKEMARTLAHRCAQEG